jgi:integrase
LLAPEDVWALYDELKPPYSIAVLTAACLGLRIEEIAALQWDDFDFRAATVQIVRAWTHGELKDVKTQASKARMPVPRLLVDELLEYRKQVDSCWLFPNRKGDKPRWTGVMLQDHIQPVSTRLGLGRIGWHSFRHSFRSYLGDGKATLAQMKDLMRHAAIATTLNVYGGTPTEKMRPLVDAVADTLKAGRSQTSTS